LPVVVDALDPEAVADAVAKAERDLRALEALLAQDVALRGDGGGKVPAPARPVNGRKRVARTLSDGMSAFARFGLRIQVTEVNGQPGAIMFDAQDRLAAVIGLDITDGQIQAIRAIANPDKLRHLGQVSDLGVQLRAGRRSAGQPSHRGVGGGLDGVQVGVAPASGNELRVSTATISVRAAGGSGLVRRLLAPMLLSEARSARGSAGCGRRLSAWPRLRDGSTGAVWGCRRW
jgi:hypothetical protein